VGYLETIFTMGQL